MNTPHASIVIPLCDEEENVPVVVSEVCAAMGERSFELLLVDDGSRDGTLDAAREAAQSDTRVRVFRLGRNYGQSTALQAGFDQARGEVVVSLDGDLQNDPAEIPRLIDALERGSDVVVGYRVRRFRNEPLRALPSWIANGVIRLWTGVKIRDTGCTLKAFRRGVLDRLYLYSDFHRFIPVVAVSLAGARLTEIPVVHRPRLHGRSKYGISRAPAVLSDLLILTMIQGSPDRPLRVFARWSLLWLLTGIALAFATWKLRLGLPLFDVNALVLPGILVLLVGLSVYLFMLGLIAELVLFLKRGGTPPPATAIETIQ